MRAARLVLAALALAGCSRGDAPEVNPFAVVGGEILSAARDRTGGTPSPAIDPARGFSQAQVAALGPTFAAYVPRADLWSSLALVSRGVGAETYVSPDEVSVAMQAHLVKNTRGLGGDLLAADLGPTIEALTLGAPFGPYARRYAFLDQRVEQAEVTATCTLSLSGNETVTLAQRAYPTQKSVEACRAGPLTFRNAYWQDLSTGVILRSEQWISPEVGVMQFYVLKD